MKDKQIEDLRTRVISEFALYKYDGTHDVYGHIIHCLVDAAAIDGLEIFEYMVDRFMLVYYCGGIYHCLAVSIDDNGIRFFGTVKRRGLPSISCESMCFNYPKIIPLCDPNLEHLFCQYISESIGLEVRTGVSSACSTSGASCCLAQMEQMAQCQ